MGETPNSRTDLALEYTSQDSCFQPDKRQPKQMFLGCQHSTRSGLLHSSRVINIKVEMSSPHNHLMLASADRLVALPPKPVDKESSSSSKVTPRVSKEMEMEK